MGRLVIKRHISSFPIKCSVCYHSENITSGLLSTHDIGDGATPTVNLCPVAVDCEMVGVGPKMLNALGRVSIVDYNGNILYDVMVRPEEEITDFRTRWSGIRPDDMRRSIPFACAQEQVERIIHGRIVVGHMIQNDFAVLRLKHPPQLVRDTARAPFAKALAGFPTENIIGLRALTLRLFGVRIQTGEHCSVEDARATMAIYRLVKQNWESGLQPKSPNLSIDKPSIVSKRLLSASTCELSPALFSSVRTLKRPYELSDPSSLDLKSLITTKKFAPSHHANQPVSPCSVIQRSASVSSLLDDDFWPDELGDLQT
ncbi:Interferon stimulated exonuclease [Paragonimus heterotremus]|uniref:RNA exonuclease 4 n=1 Tax=Paragonimus heterotremus TaxID=100268 RepID=A0A8J4SMV6_9TREM|nr:Interferon stimulated exonuclease [Paragonimus heterotremus]